MAVEDRDSEVVQILIKIASNNLEKLLNIKNKINGDTALNIAVKISKNIKIVKLLLDAAGNNVWKLLSTHNKYNSTVLQIALTYDINTVKSLSSSSL
jgi:hypothetical protein